jgi:plasmid stabilization system protein ParE
VTRLVWTAEAIGDVEAIRDYIGRTSPRYGALTAARLIQAMDPIRQFPESGRIVPEVNRREIREVIFGAFRVVYRFRVDRDLAEVLTVFRATRRFPDIGASGNP